MSDNKIVKVSAEEFSIADQEASSATVYAFTLELAKPFTYEGKTYTAMTFDFGKLTGADALAIEDEMQAAGKFVVAPTFSGQYLIRMASRASGIASDVLTALPISEYNRVRSAARSFLLNSES